MKAITKTSLVLLAALAVAGCPEDDTDTDPPPATAKPETAAPETKAETKPKEEPTDLKVDKGDTDPNIGALAKSELDGRDDGASGSKITVTGGRATFSNADGWKTSSKDSVAISESADGKGRFGAGSQSKGRDGAAAAMGLTNCKWNPDEDATVGKDKLAASVADGVCDRGAGKAKAASASFGAENVVAVGAWDDGSDSGGSFSIMRSVTKAKGGTGGGLSACCQALIQNSKSAPPQQKGAYLAAYGACQAAVSSGQGRAALGAIRAALRGANMPGLCR